MHRFSSPVRSSGAKEVGEYVLVAALVTAVCGLIEWGMKHLPGNDKREEIHIYLNAGKDPNEVEIEGLEGE